MPAVQPPPLQFSNVCWQVVPEGHAMPPSSRQTSAQVSPVMQASPEPHGLLLGQGAPRPPPPSLEPELELHPFPAPSASATMVKKRAVRMPARRKQRWDQM